MAFGTTPKGSDTIPLSSAYLENSGLFAIRGLNSHTDGSGNTTVIVEVASASGDIATGAIVDLATLLALAGTSGDANTVASIMGRLTKIRDLLNGTLTISGSVTETNSASIKTDLDTIAGAVSSAKVQANVSQINGVAPTMGNGISGTGVPRVTIASDSTGQMTLAAGSALVGSVELTDSGGTNKASISASGAIKVDNSAVTQPVSGTVTANAGTGNFTVAQATGTNLHTVVDSLPSIPTGSNVIGTITPPTSATATLSNVAASATVVTILASNASRKGGSVYNDSSSAMYLKQGTAASATSFSFKIPANTLYEINASIVYTGAYTAVWDTATGNARVTELS